MAVISGRALNFRRVLGGGVLGVGLVFSGCGGREQAAWPESAVPPDGPVVPALEVTALPDEVDGFDLVDSLIPREEILSGGPGRDGIPAIDAPNFVLPGAAAFMQPDDLVVSVTIGAETRAYPLRILVWHEIANDAIGTNRFAVTYCPLCGTCMVFSRNYRGQVVDFGVSGLLYKSDVLMYDRQTGSLWSQLKMQAVTGPMKGQALEWRPSEHLTFAAWREKYPGGKVLSTETGFNRSYGRTPYAGYERDQGVMFSVGKIRAGLKNKEWIIGLLAGDKAFALPVAGMPAKQPVVVGSGDAAVGVRYDPDSKAVSAIAVADGAAVPFVKAYWFAWQAFHPDSLIVSPK